MPNGYYQNLFGAGADWADSYLSFDIFSNSQFSTNSWLPHAHNVDVSDLDPSPLNDHGFPIGFYQDTIENVEVDPAIGNYGYRLSREYTGDPWDQTDYPIPGFVSLPLDSAQPTAQATGILIEQPAFEIESLPSLFSSTGSIVIEGTRLEMTTGSPVWSTFLVNLLEPAEALLCDLEFLTGLEAQGAASIYFDDTLVGLVESGEQSGSQTLLFGLPGTFDGLHSISFRLDSLGDVSIQIAVSDVRAVSVVPELPSFTFISALALIVGMTHTRHLSVRRLFRGNTSAAS